MISGQLSSSGRKFAIVAARFNEFIVDRLLDGAIDAIERTGGKREDLTVVRCPGAFEVPQVVRQLAHGKKHFDAIIALGCVIRGATAHFDYVAGQAASGLGAVAQASKMPIVFGVLTTETIEQAIERAGTKAGNKGFEAAMVAIEMASLYEQIQKLS